ncbi:MAG: DUF4412 domain-containing protein [Gemmatimonadales bacterium]
MALRMLPLVLLALPGVLSAQQFEGRITARTYANGKPAGEMTMSYLGSKTRIDSKAGADGFMLVNPAAGEWTMVMTRQKMFMKLDVAGMAAAAADTKGAKGTPPKITATGRSETVAGVSCEHYLIEHEDEQLDMCVAKGLGFGMFGSPSMPGNGRRPSGGIDVPLEYRELMAKYRDGFQPLKVERVKGDKREMVFEVTEIDRKPPAAEDMNVPANFNEFKMPAGMPKMPGRPPID